MSGSDNRTCAHCEINIDLLKAEGRGWTEITSHIPTPVFLVNGVPSAQMNYVHLVMYYCDNCWKQQQARMFG